MPKLKVHSTTGTTFRRGGMAFTGTPQMVDTTALGWTDQMVAELRASATGPGAALHVEDLADPTPGTPAEAVTAAKAAGESLPGHPTIEEAEDTAPRGRRGR